MLRVWVKLLLLVIGLGLYGFQAVAAEHHHELGDQRACAACVFRETSVARHTPLELPLPAPPATPVAHAAHRDVDPPPALTPSDVSFATSPPCAATRVA